MGWLFMSRYAMGGHETPKAYLDAQFTYERDLPEGAPAAFVSSTARSSASPPIMPPRRSPVTA